MGSFSGKQYKGANRDAKLGRRREAEERNAKAGAEVRACGHVHGIGVSCSGREGIDLTRVSA